MIVASVNGLALGLFLAIVTVTLLATMLAARQVRSASDFWSAGRRVGTFSNGLATAGEFTAASAFLGTTGLIFLVGFDGYLYAIATTVGLVAVLVVFAGRLRNAGRFTMTDVLAARLQETPIRAASAVSVIAVTCTYLVTQLVGAGAVVEALIGIDARWAIAISGLVILVYVAVGGMVATTWVLIIKTVLMLVISVTLAALVLERASFDVPGLIRAAAAASPAGDRYLRPGLYLDRVEAVSLCLALTLGTLGMPQLLMRFFTVSDARTARRSMGWTVGVIGLYFMLLLPLIGLGARAFLSPGGVAAAGPGGNLAVASLAQELGGGVGSTGGDVLLALVAATAFAVTVGFAAGVVIAAASAAARDLWAAVLARGAPDDAGQIRHARVASTGIVVVAVAVALSARDVNLAFLGGLVFAIAASANFPALLLTFTWRKLTTRGAVCGIVVGTVSAVTLIVLSPPVWPGPDGDGSPIGLTQPGIVSIPLGFAACWLGSLLDRRRIDNDAFERLLVRADGPDVEPAGAVP